MSSNIWHSLFLTLGAIARQKLLESTVVWNELGKIVFFGVVVPVALQVATQLTASWAEDATKKSKHPIRISLK